MKNSLIFSLILFLFFQFSSQGQQSNTLFQINAMLQAGKWYFVKKDNKTKTITYSHTATINSTETIEFKEDSLMIRCGIKCDSIRNYKIKLDVLRTRLPKQNFEYFRYCFMGKYLQLTPIRPQ